MNIKKSDKSYQVRLPSVSLRLEGDRADKMEFAKYRPFFCRLFFCDVKIGLTGRWKRGTLNRASYLLGGTIVIVTKFKDLKAQKNQK